MRRASVRDLRIRTSELLREAKNGEVIIIESRGVPIAELRAISDQPQPPLPDMSDIWDTFPQVPGDSGRFLEEDR